MRNSSVIAGVATIGVFVILTVLGSGTGVTIAMLTGCGMAVVGMGYLQSYYTIWRSTPADLRAVGESDEAIEVVGAVEPHAETLTAPFTGSECVIFETTVVKVTGMTGAEKRRFRKRVEESGADAYLYNKEITDRTVATDEQLTPYILSADTGKALVDPAGAQWEIASTANIYVQAGDQPPTKIAEYLENHPQLEAVSNVGQVFRETRLDVGDETHVFGPVNRAGSSFDLPAGSDVVIARDNPDDSFVVGEDSLSDLIQRIKSDNLSRFIINTGGELEAERRLLKTGIFWGGVGVVFLAISGGILLL